MNSFRPFTGMEAFFIQKQRVLSLNNINTGGIRMYQKVSTDLNFVQREKEVEKFWKDNDIFKKSMENRKEP